MGENEKKLEDLMNAQSWEIEKLFQLQYALRTMKNSLEQFQKSDAWKGEAAEAANATFTDLADKCNQIDLVTENIRTTIDSANDARRNASSAYENLPSAQISPYWENVIKGAAVGTKIAFPGIGSIVADKAMDVVSNFLGNQREEEAKKSLEAVGKTLLEHRDHLRDYRRDLGTVVGDPFVPIEDPEPEPISSPTPTPTSPGGGYPGPGGGGGPSGLLNSPSITSGFLEDPPPYEPPTGYPPYEPPTGHPPYEPPTPDGEYPDDGPSVDGPGGDGGIFPGGPGSGGAGGSGSGAFPGGGGTAGGAGGAGLIGGGVGGAALAAGARIGGGAGGAGGLGAASRLGSGGLLGSAPSAGAGATPGGAGASSGSGAGSGGRPGSAMMGGQGAGGSEKEKRAGGSGLLAPKLEDDEELGPRASGAQAGGREPKE